MFRKIGRGTERVTRRQRISEFACPVIPLCRESYTCGESRTPWEQSMLMDIRELYLYPWRISTEARRGGGVGNPFVIVR